MNRKALRAAISRYFEQPVARFFATIGLSPNGVTLLGLAGAGVAAYLISQGWFWAGGVAVLAAGILDMFDGALARMTGKASKFGALLDSVVDRVSEVVVLLGLLVYYVSTGSDLGAVLVYVALSGSIMVSYLRARSEGLGIECEVGIMTRPERVALTGLGLIAGHWQPVIVLVVLGVIAGLTTFTSLQRLFHSWRTLERQ
jgi:CDP-diacylglycerol--glycerol-3-phosphate 3-phosphatidyltransferase